MELAKQIYKISEIDCLEGKYQRIYYGNQFCSHLIPNKEQIKKVYSGCKDKKIELTLVLPYIIEENFSQLIHILDYMYENKMKCELVINDWGLMEYLKNNFENYFQMVLGNLLNKCKKSPAIDNIYHHLNVRQQEVLSSSSASSTIFIDLLKRYGIYRVEFENLMQGNDIKDDFPLEKTLHYPYVFVSTARKCITELVIQDKDYFDIVHCDHSCSNTKLYLKNNVWNKDMILKGNTYFYENKQFPENMETYSRLVMDTITY